ncbi:N-acetyltransferase [Skermanella stibiiresistens SB22]|uniref:N-acetyltransferase n=2 Tax=Skermanella TaxID=204447 RepID=W9H2J8_9PROT|nr:N-acetyltransferase [Skermanella stibiiresistens SB22]
MAIEVLDAAGARAAIPELCDVLIECVDGGASVSFMAPLSRDKAAAFWEGVADGVARGERVLIVARAEVIVGTVQMVPAPQENQPHRADIAKLLVRDHARGRGVAASLMAAAETAARTAGRTLLVLDTASGEAGERVYARLGWTAVGKVPGYALFPDGRPCDTTFFYKNLRARDAVDAPDQSIDLTRTAAP